MLKQKEKKSGSATRAVLRFCYNSDIHIIMGIYLMWFIIFWDCFKGHFKWDILWQIQIKELHYK